MAEALTLSVPHADRTPLLTRLRRAMNRARVAVLPRRWAIALEMRSDSRYYAKARAEAKARNASADDLYALESEAAHFYWVLEEEREMLESRRLLRQADRLMLKTPDLPKSNLDDDPDADPSWRRGTSYKPTLYLKREAMETLRAKIRAERKARREPVREVVKLVGATFGGLGGAVILGERLLRLLG